MLNIRKEYIVDAAGKPTRVILSLADFRLIEEMLGLDLDEAAIKELTQARYDRENDVPDTYIDLGDVP